LNTSLIAVDSTNGAQHTIIESNEIILIPAVGDRIVYDSKECRVDSRTFNYYEYGCVVGLLVTVLQNL